MRSKHKARKPKRQQSGRISIAFQCRL